MSTTHLQADTYPYSPGTTTRTGKPCSCGSGCPFIPTASSDARPSMTGSVATPRFIPLTSRMTIWVAPFCTPASLSRSASSAPCHRALPMKPPPTPSETQHRVTSWSIIGRFISSPNVIVIGLSTMPWILSCHAWEETWGTTSAVSIR